MTVQVVRYLMCDECLCSADMDGGLLAADLRRIARLYGWARRDGRDLCPSCASDEEVAQ